MPQEFVSAYGLEPEDYIDKLVDHFCARCPELTEVSIDEVIFVDDGPIDYLAWIAADDYDTHTFFFHDEDPNESFLQQFMALSPGAHEMDSFKSTLRELETETARLLELPDSYMPQLGERPRATIGFCHEPEEDQIVSGVNALPVRQRPDILDDVAKIVPDDDIESFIEKTVWEVNRKIEEDADRHTITTDIREELKADPDFRQETTKPLPKGIHPKYTNDESVLWQKPASTVDFMEGSQGFLQIWIPVDEEDVTFVEATAGDYDREEMVDAIRVTYGDGED